MQSSVGLVVLFVVAVAVVAYCGVALMDFDMIRERCLRRRRSRSRR